jgi:hypothetical protein
VRVVSSPDVAETVQAGGGRLYVWPRQGSCCGKANLTLDTGPGPRAGVEFDRVPAEGFELHMARMGRLPDELHLEVHGRRRKRVAAYWDGCAWVT